jgi:hypothetical protein
VGLAEYPAVLRRRGLVHLDIDAPAAALADVPEVSELLTGVVARVD